jgi:hypothetical protein
MVAASPMHKQRSLGCIPQLAALFMTPPAPLLPAAPHSTPGASQNEPALRSFRAQPCFLLSNKEVEVAVTQLGGHTAPVTFFRDSSQPIQPYHVSPWQEEPPTAMPAPVLVPLRGDFFCLPFGGNTEALHGEKHPPHGEIVGSPWTYLGTKSAGEVTTLSLSFASTARKGFITKELSLVSGQNVLYSTHSIEGFAGRTPLGHHATLAMPEKEGAVRIATSPFSFGMTCPGVFSEPSQREYQFLLPGAMWTDLTKVPSAWKLTPDADLTRMPARQGFADLVQINSEPREKTGAPGWTTATYAEAGYLWFSLRDQTVLRSTVFWMENRGRHGHPWNGRNNCLGLEDVTAHFADGLAPSVRDNALTQHGVPTALELTDAHPTVIHYIQGVVRIPAGFDNVHTLQFSPGAVTFVSTSGKRVTTAVRHEFLTTGKL